MSRSKTGVLLVALALSILPCPARTQDADEPAGDEFIESAPSILIEGPIDMGAVLRRVEGLGEPYIDGNGDVNADGARDVSDAIYLLNWIFRSGPAPAAAPCALPAVDREEETAPFRTVALHVDLNEADGDAEIVLEVGTASKQLAALTLHDPLDRKIADVRASQLEQGRIGLDEVVIESGQSTFAELVERYPEGEYLVQAVTTDGKRFAVLVALSHELRPAPGFRVGADAEGLRVEWSPIEGADRYVFELEQDDLGLQLSIELDPSSRSFAVPRAFLPAGLEYQVSLSTVSENGNISTGEVDFELPALEPTEPEPAEAP